MALLTYPRPTAFGSTGRTEGGALLYIHLAGTSTLAAIYSDPDLTAPLTNPVEADAYGLLPAIYAATGAYKWTLKTERGVQLWSVDDVPSAGTGEGGGTPGDDGLSVAEIACYKRADAAPTTPAGGSYNFTTQTLSAPAGWSGDIPAGTAPVWTSRTVAAVEGTAGTDATLIWSAPVQVFAEGSAVNIVFKRNGTQPATPAPSAGVPSTWYDSVDDVPVTADPLWSSVGTRAHTGLNWTWQTPVQVEGDTGPQGPAGTDGTLYYIKPTSGTAIKNGSGTLTVEARRLVGGTDTLLSTGTIKLYVGSTLVTAANGYVAGSDGYTGIFDSGDISGSTVVTLKDGAGGTALDTITLVDVVDGTVGGVGTDAVYGYVEANGPLAWVRGTDQTTFDPVGTTRQLDCTFVQGGADVARVAWLITRDSGGILTGATTTHSGGDLNSGRVTVTELGESTRAMSVRFAYSYSGDETAVTETVYTSLSGATGPTGPQGPAGLSISLTKPHIPLQAYTNGSVVSFSAAEGYAKVFSGGTDVTASATLSSTPVSCTGEVNTADNTPYTSYVKGYYRVTALTADTATLQITATYSGNTISQYVTISKVNVGYEIVGALPATNLFLGRVVFLTSDAKLYRYDGSNWTRAVDGADLLANSVTTNAVNAGAITAAKIAVSDLSSVSANVGTVTAGKLESGSGGTRIDLDNARIIINTSPGTTAGHVRVIGYAFGPSSNYVDWFGPKPSGQVSDAGIIANLTDAEAMYFLKTDGSMVSGGRVRGEFEPKAWCKFDGRGGVVLKDRFNVSGIVRNSEGRYTVTFASALPNANYTVSVNANRYDSDSDPQVAAGHTYTTSGFQIVTKGAGGSVNDCELINFTVFGSNVVGGSNVDTPGGGYGGGTIGGGNVP